MHIHTYYIYIYIHKCTHICICIHIYISKPPGPPTNFSLFQNLFVPNWSWSLSGSVSETTCEVGTFLPNMSDKRLPEGPRMAPKMSPNQLKSMENQFCFRSGASRLQLLVPRVPGGGYRTPMDSQINQTNIPKSRKDQ